MQVSAVSFNDCCACTHALENVSRSFFLARKGGVYSQTARVNSRVILFSSGVGVAMIKSRFSKMEGGCWSQPFLEVINGATVAVFGATDG